jgi:hypothetical protein
VPLDETLHDPLHAATCPQRQGHRSLHRPRCRTSSPPVGAFDERDVARTNQYSFEQDRVGFDRAQTREFRANRKAWAFFEAQPPSYRKPAIWWVISAKKEETRARRLATLIDDSEHGLRIKQLRRD